MKIIFRTAVLAALIITASCGKDDSPSGNEVDQVAEEQEQTPIESNLVADNVVIAGGEKISGTPPSPNEAISLDLSNASKTAFLNEGFDIPFSSNGDVTGAYLQFKSNDGTVADSYYDINVATNSTGKTVSIKSKAKKRLFGHTEKVNEATLDVDFTAQIEPGTFCYVICVYDAQGNISAPQEVCVTVESWGGNSALVADWKLTKEEYFEQGVLDVDVAGVEECSTDTQNCTNGGSFEYTECYLSEFGKINFKSDGTFTSEFKGGEDYLNYTLSVDNCSANYLEYVYHYTSSGQWAYASDEKRLTLIEYSYNDMGTDGDGVGAYQPGEGYVLFSGVADLDGTNLILTESYEDIDNSGDYYKSFFEK